MTNYKKNNMCCSKDDFCPDFNQSKNRIKHFLSIEDITKKELQDILYLTKRLKLKKNKFSTALQGKTLGLLFNKPSTRTRVSFEAGMYQLGGDVVFLTEKDIQLGRGESIYDTAKVLSRYLDGIVIRTYKHKYIIEFSQNSKIPVINGLTDLLHPCQIVSDIFTIVEKKGYTKNINLAYIGDGSNNMAHSWLLACGKTGINLKIASPSLYQPYNNVMELAQNSIRQNKQGSIEITQDPETAIYNADIVYTDVWVSMGQEKEQEERLNLFKPYQINSSLIKKAKPNALIMHCLPAHLGQEITEDLLYSPQSIVFDQAENRMHTQKALLIQLMK